MKKALFVLALLASVPAVAGETVVPTPGAVSFCVRYPAECPKNINPTVSFISRQLLEDVNFRVNHELRSPRKDYQPDRGELAQWDLSPPVAWCNDYAVTKRHELAKFGVSYGAMRLYVVRGVEYHLVLAVNVAGRWLVLDNRYDSIRDLGETGYELSSYSSDGWTWYRV